jgi:hypothetical protein
VAHSLTPSDVLYPNGDLQSSLFERPPALAPPQIITVWLNQAQTLITAVDPSLQNYGALHYCYARAYRAMALRLGATPNSSGDSGNPMNVNRDWGEDRIAFWDNKANQEEQLFVGVGGTLPLPSDITPQGGFSGSVPVVVVW